MQKALGLKSCLPRQYPHWAQQPLVAAGGTRSSSLTVKKTQLLHQSTKINAWSIYFSKDAISAPSQLCSTIQLPGSSKGCSSLSYSMLGTAWWPARSPPGAWCLLVAPASSAHVQPLLCDSSILFLKQLFVFRIRYSVQTWLNCLGWMMLPMRITSLKVN